MKPSLVLAFLTLAGCESVPAPPATVTLAIAVACRPEPGPEPLYADSDAALEQPFVDYAGPVPAAAEERAALAHYLRTQKLVAGRLQRIARDAELAAALDACRGITP